MRMVTARAGSGLALVDAPDPMPSANQALVRVDAISLNRGEVRLALSDAPSARPGWDFAGVVEKAAAKSGPGEGTRVVGVLPGGAWCERLAVEPQWIAPLPDGVSFAQAATLPVAGLTAYHALRLSGSVIGRQVLVTGASGGVGHFACQLASIAGADVWGAMRDPNHAAALERDGVRLAGVVTSAAQIREAGPFDVILDSVGGTSLGHALGALKPDGTVVSFGISEARDSTFDVRQFFHLGGLRLLGLALFHELRTESASIGLARLAGLVAAGRVKTNIEVEAPIREIGDVARRMYDRQILGKAVLHF